MRWDDRIVVVLALVAAPLLSPPAARAHDTTTYHHMRWNATSATWRFTPSVPDGYRQPSRTGAGVWNDIGRSFVFVEGAAYTTNFDPVCGTGTWENSVHVTALNPTSPRELAVTRRCVSSTDNNEIRRFAILIRDADPFNAPRFYNGTGAQNGRPDIQATMAHEFGHAHGAEHFNEETVAEPIACPTPATITYSTMCWDIPGTLVYQRSPEPHDIHTFANVYSGSNSICGYVVYGAIRTAYLRVGGSGGRDGCPIVEEADTANFGRRQDLQSGSIVWHQDAGAYEVRGAIRTLYDSLGGASYGFPTTDESPTPDGAGYHNHFMRPGVANTCGSPGSRSIYWHPSTGAHNVQGEIRKKWCALGWEGSYGYPTTNETGTPDGRGFYNHFLRIGETATCSSSGNRSIYWRSETGAHEIHGAIRQRWCALGWEGGNLGYPTTDELTTASGVGRYTHFTRYSGTTRVYDGSIFWSPTTNAWEVFNKIRDEYASLSWERGLLGYPTGAQASITGGQRSVFQGGHIYWATGAAEAHEMHGPVLTRFLQDGGATKYGFPLTDVYRPATGGTNDQQVDFASYSIRYVAATNSTVVCPGRC